MKIALVLNPIAEASPAGLGRAVLLHAQQLMRSLPQHTYVLITKEACDLERLFPRDVYIYETEHIGGKAFWSTTQFWHRQDIDVFVFFTPPIPLLLPRKKIVTLVHDFAFMYYEPFFRRVGMWFLHTYACWRSTVVCAVSAYTRDEIRAWCSLPTSHIRVVYNGCDHLPIKHRSHHESDHPFFLHVGVMKARKNTLRIVMAFQKFVRQHQNYRLVLVGDAESAYGREVCSYIHTHALDAFIEVRGFVSDTVLSELYTHASGFVFPSVVEGFGFPILEAMAVGLPVLTSQQGALAEIAADAAVLVDPTSTESIAGGMEKLTDPLLRAEGIKKGYERVHYFTWQRAGILVSEAVTESMSHSNRAS